MTVIDFDEDDTVMYQKSKFVKMIYWFGIIG